MFTKILITGLTLHNNKGGPALAISLAANLKPLFKNPKFHLCVQDFKDNYIYESKWSKIYKFDGVIKAINSYDLISFSAIKNLFTKRNKIKSFVNDLSNFHIIVDLNALSYMDFQYYTLKQNIMRNLNIYLIRYYSNKLKIPLIRWTQSFGPFNNFVTKFLLKLDLNKQKFVFTRGKISSEYIRALIKKPVIFSFPDIAITLPYSNKYYYDNLHFDKYLSISPSSVLYKLKGSDYLNELVKIITKLSKKYNIVFVPHNLMNINPSLYNCDLKICLELSKYLNDEIVIINEDLDVLELKGIIAHSYIHIGSRYHSIIAAISTYVPTIAFSWHHKYLDILRLYHIDRFIYKGGDTDKFFDLFFEVEKNHLQIKTILKQNHKKNLKNIQKNLDLFTEMIPHEMQNL
ncbi:MAG: polysaccharide pyruvyl transferase family protein [bacterium]